MILSAQSIRRCITSQRSIIFPFHERTLHEQSGTTFGLSSCGYDVRMDQSMAILPYSFELCSTMEYFDIPDNVVGRVHDKSTWARRGLAVQNTVIEPGWRGYLTIELTNHGEQTIVLERGTPIAQIIFEQLDEPTVLPYTGKYQDQERGPQKAR